ncbi:MAG TPA: AvaI/BsoBI family type II restriction endonuclease [Candidatus Acidoferrales bacterium]|nr:AvaI/BsoBI family type II restriction endonuclease [Candidatus Acidoferrales bacterium]
MAKGINPQTIIEKPEDLVTSKEETRAGFIKLALEKNYLAMPYIEEARALRAMAGKVQSPKELLKIEELKAGLLTASGLSEKSLKHLTDEDKTSAIKQLIEKFLEPAGDKFVDELTYRYLLTRGGKLGGEANNLAGQLGQRKFIRTLISVFNLAGITYYWKDSDSDSWIAKPNEDTDLEKRANGFYWKIGRANRLLIINTTVPAVKKNVDVCVLDGRMDDLRSDKHRESIIYSNESYIALGELKGGLDPAGADEHWKTANSALSRIRSSFRKKKLSPHTFFVGAAIENSMAKEIFNQLQNGILGGAANLTKDEQLTAICSWIVRLKAASGMVREQDESYREDLF